MEWMDSCAKLGANRSDTGRFSRARTVASQVSLNVPALRQPLKPFHQPEHPTAE
jgi:hypothetical protein